MKHKITFFAVLLSTGLFAACSGNHPAKQGRPDTVRYPHPANAYRDTFKTTTTTGDATNLDNGGSGGTMIAKPKMDIKASAKPDTLKK